MSCLGENMKRRRKMLGLSQKEIAQQLSVHRTTYTRYENGRLEPSLDTLCQIADLLDCSVDMLLGRNK